MAQVTTMSNDLEKLIKLKFRKQADAIESRATCRISNEVFDVTRRMNTSWSSVHGGLISAGILKLIRDICMERLKIELESLHDAGCLFDDQRASRLKRTFADIISSFTDNSLDGRVRELWRAAEQEDVMPVCDFIRQESRHLHASLVQEIEIALLSEKTRSSLVVREHEERGVLDPSELGPAVLNEIVRLNELAQVHLGYGLFRNADFRAVTAVLSDEPVNKETAHCRVLSLNVLIIDSLNVDALKKQTGLGGGESLVALEQVLGRITNKANDHVNRLRALRWIRQGFPTHHGEEVEQKRIQSFQQMGIECPISDCAQAWIKVLEFTRDSLEALYRDISRGKSNQEL